MARVRISTTVDGDVLAAARRLYPGSTVALVADEALLALVARHRSTELDAGYAAYDAQPIDEPDAWGDLHAFRRDAAAS